MGLSDSASVLLGCWLTWYTRTMLLYDREFVREGWLPFMVTALIVIDSVIGVVLIATVLLQTGYSPGAGALGGGSSVQPYSGKKKGIDEFLARMTTILGGAFGVVTLLLSHFWH